MNLKKEKSNCENVDLGKNVDLSIEPGNKNIVLAGGCFWGTQEFLRRLPGVMRTFVAYANGNCLDPSYEKVCTGTTRHAESVYVEYDPEVIDLGHLLYYFFHSFDPTQLNRQGNDIGEQYRNGIYFLDEADLPAIKEAIARAQKEHEKPLVTEVLPLANLSVAEEHHQNYLVKNPLGYCHVNFNNLPRENTSLKGDIYE